MGSTKSEAEARNLGEVDMAKMVVGGDNLESGSEVGASRMHSSDEALATVGYGSSKDHDQVIDHEGYTSDYDEDTGKGTIHVQGTSQPPEDEGYVSAGDSSGCPERCPEHLSAQPPQTQQVLRSTLFEPFDSPEHGEIARPPLLALLSTSTPSLPLPTLPHRRSDGDRRLSSFPSLQTFDDIPGLEQESPSGAETMRLVADSRGTTSRAHHHWLRPCAACARKAGAASKGWHLLLKTKSGDNTNEQRGGRGEKEASVYRRTAHWVKKQEERIKHL
ncbi:hypothetical protein MMC26_003038 [Xylographa opegraphella]|nr:hypothetical protein [Xylographa opegraphella]